MCGETATVILEFHNRSTVNIPSFAVTLFRSLTLKATTSETFHCTEIVSTSRYNGRLHIYNIKISQRLLTCSREIGIGAGLLAVGENARRLELQLMSSNGTLPPGTSGSIVCCRYWIDIEVPLTCGSSSIEVNGLFCVLLVH